MLQYRSTSDMELAQQQAEPNQQFDELHEASPIDEASMQTCYCKTQSLQFKSFHLEVNGEMLNFYKSSRHYESEYSLAFKHSIHDIHVQLGPPEKCKTTNRTYFSVALVFESGLLRVIYFPSIEIQEE